MRRTTAQRVGLAALVLIAGPLMLAGCESGKSNHEKWVDKANNRWHRMRSSVLMDMARQQFESGDLKRAKESVNEGLRLDSDNADLLLLGGRIAVENGRLERGFHLFERAIKADEKLARGYYYKGLVHQRWQQYDKANQSYKQAYDLKPDKVAFLLARSEMLVQLDRADEAIALLEKKRTYFDQDSTLRVALGHLYNMQKRYDKARVMFKEASLLDPDNARIQEELGLAQLASGQAKQAARTFEKLFATSPQSARADLRRALANAYLQLGRSQAARREYLELARSEKGEARDWVRLGELSWRADEAQAALDAAHRAMSEAPNNPRGYMLAGMVFEQRGDLEQALRMFDRAAKLAPDTAEPLILRGLSLHRAGRHAAAVTAYEKALKRSPKDPRLKQLIQSANQTHS